MLKNMKANIAPGQMKQPGLFGRFGRWLRERFEQPDDAAPKIRPGFRFAVEHLGGYPTVPGNLAARKRQRAARRVRRMFNHA